MLRLTFLLLALSTSANAGISELKVHALIGNINEKTSQDDRYYQRIVEIAKEKGDDFDATCKSPIIINLFRRNLFKKLILTRNLNLIADTADYFLKDGYIKYDLSPYLVFAIKKTNGAVVSALCDKIIENKIEMGRSRLLSLFKHVQPAESYYWLLELFRSKNISQDEKIEILKKSDKFLHLIESFSGRISANEPNYYGNFLSYAVNFRELKVIDYLANIRWLLSNRGYMFKYKKCMYPSVYARLEGDAELTEILERKLLRQEKDEAQREFLLVSESL